MNVGHPAKYFYKKMGPIAVGQTVLGLLLATVVQAAPLNTSESSTPLDSGKTIAEVTAVESILPTERPDSQFASTLQDESFNPQQSFETSTISFTPGLTIQQPTSYSATSTALQQIASNSDKPASASSVKSKQPATLDGEFIMPPRTAQKEKLNPFTTTFILNGTPISHLTKWELATGYDFGENRSENFNQSGVVTINSTVQESITRKNVYAVDQKGSYLQLKTIRQTRKVAIEKKEPQTITGLQIQLSLTGNCVLPGTSPTDQCTYTPGLITDNNSIDPDFLVPTQILQTSDVGDVVTPESLAVMQLPGFQQGANGQQLGIDLYFPNAGARPGNTQSDQTTVERTEDIETVPSATYSRVRQVVKANYQKAVIGRTIHGITAIPNDKNTLLNSALQLGAQLLPDVIPHLEGSTSPVNSNVNKNLFLAANNTRIPENSFTIYQAGLGQADSLKPSAKKLSDIPAATFNSVWFGLSPVTERSYSTGYRYEVTGPQMALASSGAEGGVNDNVNFTTASNTAGIISTGQLQNFYAQIYLSFYNQNANFVTYTQLTERTNYFPHFGFTGNITRSDDVFRYYAGVITADELKAYLGLDYTKTTRGGWSFSVGGIGYLNPDRDYYSQVQGSVSKKFSWGRDKQFILGSNLIYAIDRETQIGSTTVISPASSVSVSASTRLGPVSFGVTHYFGGILPNSVRNMLLFNAGLQLGKNVVLSAYATPLSENSDRSPYGVSAQVRLGKHYNSPTLSFSWSNHEYQLGTDTVGRQLQSSNNVFSLTFRMGEPAAPFDAESAKRLNQQIDRESEEYLKKQNKLLLDN